MNRTLPSEQDVDQLLDAFFKSEMPRDWPAFEPPARRVLPFHPAAPRRRRFVLGSRLALAASVALLMACGWLLSGSFDGPTSVKSRYEHRPGEADLDKTKPRNVPMPKLDADKDHEVSDFISR